MLLWLGSFTCFYLSIYISMSRRSVPTSFPQWPSRPLLALLFKKANHFVMTTLNIRSDPMATWECAKQVQASPHSCQLLTFFCLREGVLDAFYLLQTARKVISSDGLIYLRSEDDADLNIRIEYHYASGAVPGL